MSGSTSLRERKMAKTKLALLDAALRRLEEVPLEDIRVKDLCDEVEISQASFFNYFATKADLLIYFVALWSLEMSWHCNRLSASSGGLAAIEALFELTAERSAKQPQVMGEIVAFQARARSKPTLASVSPVEAKLAFPSLDGIEDIDARELGAVLWPLVDQAVSVGELPATTDRAQVVTSLATIFFGVPAVLHASDPDRIGATYREMLRRLWVGLSSPT